MVVSLDVSMGLINNTSATRSYWGSNWVFWPWENSR